MIDELNENNLVSKGDKFLFFWNKNKKGIILFICFAVVFSILYISIHTPPRNFPLNEILTVYPGESLQEISENLKQSGVIKYPLVFRAHVIALGGEKSVMAGDYLLDRVEGPASLAYRLVRGKFHIETVKITIPEGWNVFQIADYLSQNLINFDRKKFINLAQEHEGFLFPDTYFVSPAIKYEKLIELFRNNFDSKIKGVSEIFKSRHSLKEIITMASILEAEARTTESRKIISGILWKRLSINMALQVDATFMYINGKNTYELTLDDLKIDSPYNTYKFTGLPLTPINNPGLDSIIAAVQPTSTKYLYYLSSKGGEMYYATTFDGHKRNRELYLNK